MPHSESRKTSGCDAVVFRKRPLDAVCLTVWNGTHATLEKQEADSGEVSSQHSVGFFKDGCTNLLWRRAAGWLDWMGRDEPERQRAESQWIVAARPLCHLEYPVAYLSNLKRILPAARWKLNFKAATETIPSRRLSQRHVPFGDPTVGRQADGGRIPLVRTSSELAVRRAGKVPEGTVPSPSPGRHAATRSRRGCSLSSPPTADGFGTGTPVPSPQSQSFSRSYESILPTSLAYIVPSTKGCSPWVRAQRGSFHLLSPSMEPPSRGLGPSLPLTTALQTTIRMMEPPDSKAGLFPVRSPLLREYLRALGIMASGTICVQRLNGSRDSEIHTKYRISPRSSSMRDPRYPLSKVVFIYRRSTGPPNARRGRGARGRLSIQVFLGAFRTEVRWSPAARAEDGGRRSCVVPEHPARADSPVVKHVRGVVLLCSFRQ
ncbi:hypothetical protein CQW23_30681 [Capsicum baccatum]|uniref:Uncharacterized protein n=1 Tax=Capsicum baccatum TaxID=33114 RepID=A0A2G2V9N5_CAPBA|nr:hypothetical protein CQW23_30681 [Capsicum baccatum]